MGEAGVTSTITSRCGSVSLMGLGLTIIGVVMAALIVGAGQIWLVHQDLQDALNNAILAMSPGSNATATTLASLVKKDGSFSEVVVNSFDVVGSSVNAEVTTPIHLWFWAPWMGSVPPTVSASS